MIIEISRWLHRCSELDQLRVDDLVNTLSGSCLALLSTNRIKSIPPSSGASLAKMQPYWCNGTYPGACLIGGIGELVCRCDDRQAVQLSGPRRSSESGLVSRIDTTAG